MTDFDEIWYSDASAPSRHRQPIKFCEFNNRWPPSWKIVICLLWVDQFRERSQTHHCTKFRPNWSFRCGDNTVFQIFIMVAAAILDFWNCIILLAIWVERVETHQHAKCCQNRSIGCEDIKIFRFFKMAADAILDYQIRKILLADGVWRAQTYRCTKFHQNWSFHCRDIAIFQILKMAAAAILDFYIRKFYWLLGWRGLRRLSVPNFVKIGQSVAKILRFFFDFSRWRPSAILDSFWAYLDHQLWVLVCFYHCAEFGYEWCSFYNMNI